MNEPSVLDYVKAKLAPWKGIRIDFPSEQSSDYRDVPIERDIPISSFDRDAGVIGEAEAIPDVRAGAQAAIIPWRLLATIFLALLAQRAFEPPDRSVVQGILFYALAALSLAWAAWTKDLTLDSARETVRRIDSYSVRQGAFVVGALLSMLALLTFGGNRFTPVNVTLWLSGLGAIIYSLWLSRPAESRSWLWRVKDFVGNPVWDIKVSRRSLFVLAVIVLAVFFRFYRMDQVPPEMFSDHAEKLLDVQDVLNGQMRIFFPRNTGREALQMALTAGIAKYLGTGISFASLKIGTILAGLLTLPFVYLLGKEVGNRRIALMALLFAGVAYWPNVISRVGLRFPFYPLFAAPALYFMVRGLRTSDRNSFIWAGLAVGMGLHGYSPARAIPLVVTAGFLVYLLHEKSREDRQQAVWYFMILALVALIVFLPLGRFALENPELYNYRAMTRVGNIEQPLPGPAWQIFLKNLGNALLMFHWNNGETWVHSIVFRPALDVISAAFLFLGTLLIILRYVQEKNWLDIFLLVSIPLLMLPSILSLAFPNENPSLNRAGGALVPVFIIVGFGFDHIVTSLRSRLREGLGKLLAVGLAALLIVLSARQNYDLVFNQYYRQFLYSSWNTTELGRVIRAFDDSIGSPDSAWVVAYPHWVDTRLVGINAGYPTRDFGILPENLKDTVETPDTKLFLLKPEDEDAIQALKLYYPQGTLSKYTSKVESKDFLMYFVPPAGTSEIP
jgi:hypothetical protein